MIPKSKPYLLALVSIWAYPPPPCLPPQGGGSSMDAAKMMWLMYEIPSTDFKGLSQRFMDPLKRIYEVRAGAVSGAGAELLHRPLWRGVFEGRGCSRAEARAVAGAVAAARVQRRTVAGAEQSLMQPGRQFVLPHAYTHVNMNVI